MVLLLLLPLAACSSSSSSSSDDPAPAPSPPSTWVGLQPGDARTYSGDAGELTFLYVDETYFIDGENVSAFTYEHADTYVTDYFLADSDGVEWYGRRGSWRAGRSGEEPRDVPLDAGTATFSDITLVLSPDGPPTSIETPDGVFELE